MWIKLDFLPWDRSERKVILNLQRSISASHRWAMTMHKREFNTNYIVYTNMGNATINEHINGKTTDAKEGTNTMRAHTIIKWQVNDKEGWFSCCHRISIAHIQFQIWFNLTLLLVTFFKPFGVKMLRWTRLAVKFIQFGLTTIGFDVVSHSPLRRRDHRLHSAQYSLLYAVVAFTFYPITIHRLG